MWGVRLYGLPEHKTLLRESWRTPKGRKSQGCWCFVSTAFWEPCPRLCHPSPLLTFRLPALRPALRQPGWVTWDQTAGMATLPILLWLTGLTSFSLRPASLLQTYPAITGQQLALIMISLHFSDGCCRSRLWLPRPLPHAPAVTLSSPFPFLCRAAGSPSCLMVVPQSAAPPGCV